MKHQTVKIGTVDESTLIFESNRTALIKEPKEIITFLKQKYCLVNTEFKCYIKADEYNRLFSI